MRPLRLVLIDRTEHGARLLADLGIAWTKPAGVSDALKAMGYDGLALDGGEAGFHLVLGSVRGRGVNSRTALAGIGVAIGPCG